MMDDFSASDLYFWRFPSESELITKNYILPIGHILNLGTHIVTIWSRRNTVVCKNKTPLILELLPILHRRPVALRLHTYMMYLKFGFGRATRDAGIEIRRGAMSRNRL